MNTATKIFAFFLAITLLVGACRNASDDTDPGISDFRVDNTTSLTGEGDHELGTIATFTMNLNDNRGLEEFQVDVNGELDYTENIEGSTTFAASYPFTIDADNYNVGERIQLTFIAADEYGNTFAIPYFANIVE